MRIALIRHLAPLIAPGICYGRLDVAADSSADEQMGSKLGSDPRLHGARRVWTSPAIRCRGLADTIARALAVPVAVDPRLWELDFGAWEGQAWEAIRRADLDRWAASLLTVAPPGGEAGAELNARVRDFHADLCRGQEDCVVVSHGGPLKVLEALLLGRPIDLLAGAPAIGSVTYVTCQINGFGHQENPVVVRVNQPTLSVVDAGLVATAVETGSWEHGPVMLAPGWHPRLRPD